MSVNVTATGLTEAEVNARIAEGRVNIVPTSPVRTTRQIVRANVLTPVNAIMITLFVLILVAGSPKDGLFVGVVISNSVIGIAQELRARKELRKLALLSEPRARVVRDGESMEIQVEQVVADDLLELAPGDQVVVDGNVTDALGLQLDESLLTGESDAVEKVVGDEVLSGSFVAAGSGFYVATRIGADSYASSLGEEARQFKLAESELRIGVNQILKWLVIIIPPAAALLFLSLLDAEENWRDALIGTVAAAVAMVPDGLVLLISMAFLSGVIALARQRALAKELATVELLARVDVLCLDKTGTITTGEIGLGGIEAMGNYDTDFAEAALGAMAATDPNPNNTLLAIAGRYTDHDGWIPEEIEPFSSSRKWAAARFAEQGVFYLGAPDILFDENDDEARAAAQEHFERGRRVLLLCRASEPLNGSVLPPDRDPVALVLLEDTIRPDAPEIFDYFERQGVELKVISGDNPTTVAAVAERAGVAGAEIGIDARDLPEDNEALADVLDDRTVFGRVTPHQKRAMVAALQSRGHTVAMTGDGVNDVLALKDSDMGIAMGSGSSATRAVAQLVLLDDSFSTLPQVLAEGRKVINNTERVANLFVTKAAYAVLITAVIGLLSVPFPFLPRHLTLIGTLSIGIPGFILALAPNTNLVRPGFLDRVLRFSIPAGIIAGTATLIVYEGSRRHSDVLLEEARTAATMTLLLLGLVILLVASRPVQLWKVGLAAIMGLGYVTVMLVAFLRDFFELNPPPGWVWGPIAVAVLIGGALIAAVPAVMPGLTLHLPPDIRPTEEAATP
jgi:cation-transporting ATPase E